MEQEGFIHSSQPQPLLLPQEEPEPPEPYKISSPEPPPPPDTMVVGNDSRSKWHEFRCGFLQGLAISASVCLLSSHMIMMTKMFGLTITLLVGLICLLWVYENELEAHKHSGARPFLEPQLISQVFQYLDTKHLKNCRLVCRQWNLHIIREIYDGGFVTTLDDRNPENLYFVKQLDPLTSLHIKHLSHGNYDSFLQPAIFAYQIELLKISCPLRHVALSQVILPCEYLKVLKFMDTVLSSCDFQAGIFTNADGDDPVAAVKPIAKIPMLKYLEEFRIEPTTPSSERTPLDGTQSYWKHKNIIFLLHNISSIQLKKLHLCLGLDRCAHCCCPLDFNNSCTCEGYDMQKRCRFEDHELTKFIYKHSHSLTELIIRVPTSPKNEQQNSIECAPPPIPISDWFAKLVPQIRPNLRVIRICTNICIRPCNEDSSNKETVRCSSSTSSEPAIISGPDFSANGIFLNDCAFWNYLYLQQKHLRILDLTHVNSGTDGFWLFDADFIQQIIQNNKETLKELCLDSLGPGTILDATVFANSALAKLELIQSNHLINPKAPCQFANVHSFPQTLVELRLENIIMDREGFLAITTLPALNSFHFFYSSEPERESYFNLGQIEEFGPILLQLIGEAVDLQLLMLGPFQESGCDYCDEEVQQILDDLGELYKDKFVRFKRNWKGGPRISGDQQCLHEKDAEAD